MCGLIRSLALVIMIIAASLVQSCSRDRSRDEAQLKAGSVGAPSESGDTFNAIPAPSYSTDSAVAYADEEYQHAPESQFLSAVESPLSTFSIDVDPASYSNVRRMINEGRMPERDAVRIEELINYFDYDYSEPYGDDPFSITTDMATCPWNREHMLVHIGLKGRSVDVERTAPNNLVFLIDVSGSMASDDKLPLLKQSLRLLVNQLRSEDRVALVVYAGAAGVVLSSTPGSERGRIMEAIDRLEAGGSTAGAEGIQLAYEIARDNFTSYGNNRVILATDGDFNVGVSSDEELVRLIEEKRRSGIFLTVLGFGTGNLKDSKMEQLADKGNGQYAYIDNINEARKVLVREAGGTLVTIAKDVKIQVEFNPAVVREYRLIGYENRALAAEDFNDDAKDAGELGAGHTVTALYEVVPAVRSGGRPRVDPLKYGSPGRPADLYGPGMTREGEPLMTVKLRYKEPRAEESRKIEREVPLRSKSIENASTNLKLAAAVAEWGMLLRNSDLKGSSTFDDVLYLARDARGNDDHGYRAEFISLVEMSRRLAGR